MAQPRSVLSAMGATLAPGLVIVGFRLMGWSEGLSAVVAVGVLVLVASYAVVSGGFRRRSEESSTPGSLDWAAAAAVPDVGARAEAIFRVDDPDFSRDRLIVTANKVAAQLGGDDLAALHPFVSDGLFQRLSTHRRLGKVPNEVQAFVGRGPVSVVYADVSVGTHYQHATLRMTLGEASQAQTVALTFLRKRLARTRARGLAEARCPHCGGPLQLTASQRCEHCDVIVNSGAYDWVLCALSPGAHQLAPPVDLLDPDRLREHDPNLAPEELVDRASLGFWRWVEARQHGDFSRLGRVATEQFLQFVPEGPAPEGNVTLGGGELRTLRSADGFDQAEVLVRWADTPEGVPRAHRTVLKLRRPHGLRTAEAAGLSTLRCPGCLGTVTDAESANCAYCDASLRDAWCLHQLEDFGSWMAAAVELRKTLGGDWARVATSGQRQMAFGLLVSLAAADGEVGTAERARLVEVSARWGLPPGQLEAALVAPPVHPPRFSRELSLSLTRELAELAFVDGVVAPRERKRLEALAAALGTETELSRAWAALIARR